MAERTREELLAVINDPEATPEAVAEAQAEYDDRFGGVVNGDWDDSGGGGNGPPHP